MAPETFGRVYSEKSDVWSYGALLVEMLSGTIPFGSNLGLADVIVGVRDQGWTPLVVMGPQATQVDIQWLQTAPKYLVLLMKLCFQREASERPSFSEIVSFLEQHVPENVAKEEARIQKRTEKREKLLKAIDEIAIS
jgi:serine/threonine protein kinase